MKPMLACDVTDLNKVQYPIFLQPKIDGVRALNIEGRLVGRSLKTHANVASTAFYSIAQLAGMDGEMHLGPDNAQDLCRATSSVLTTIEGEPTLCWTLFDYFGGTAIGLPYAQRLELLRRKVETLHDSDLHAGRVKVVQNYTCLSAEDVLDGEAYFLQQGYEGVILRGPETLYKQGRSTMRVGQLLRLKRFVTGEFRIEELIEGQTNENVAQVNELGQQFRTTHAANMLKNGMVGAMQGTVVNNILDLKGEVLFTKGSQIRVAAGTMTHAERLHYFQNPHLILGQLGTFKTFPVGVKDKPRFPTFQGIRSEVDM